MAQPGFVDTDGNQGKEETFRCRYGKAYLYIPDITPTLKKAGMLDGRKTAPAEVRVVKKEAERTVLEIVLREGRNRQIRRMCEMLGLEVARLKRVAIGQVKLGMLKQGDWRDLTPEEVKKLTADPNPSRHIK